MARSPSSVASPHPFFRRHRSHVAKETSRPLAESSRFGAPGGPHAPVWKCLRSADCHDRQVIIGGPTFPPLSPADNGNHAYQINLTNNLGIPTLSVRGSNSTNNLVPGNVTAINS